jgi:hypothetical protein
MAKDQIIDNPRGTAYLRNKQTGEVRAVQTHSEFDELVSQRESDGVTTIWEQTGEHDVKAHAPEGEDKRVLRDYGHIETVGEAEGEELDPADLLTEHEAGPAPQVAEAEVSVDEPAKKSRSRSSAKKSRSRSSAKK